MIPNLHGARNAGALIIAMARPIRGTTAVVMAAAKGVVTLIKASTPRREEQSHWEGGEEERE